MEEKVVKKTGVDDRDRQKERSPKNQWENEIINVLQSIETDYSQFRENIHSLRKNLQGFMEETETKLRDVRKEAESKVEPEEMKKGVGRARKDIQDVGKKLEDVMGEIGFGESLDVSKIPPNILEGVYETTLEDIISTMRKNLGTHDTDKRVREALEMMRTRTSGSELFQYDGKKINVRNLVPSIEQKLISAKQVHSTYTELLTKLVEHIPGYQPKNFRAMMKSKSLEFAIDKVTKLIHKTNKLETAVSNSTQIVSSFSSQFNSRLSEIRQEIKSTEDNIMEKVDERFLEFDERIEKIENSLTILDSLEERLETLDRFEEDRNRLEKKIVELSTILDMEVDRLEDHLPEEEDETPETVHPEELPDEERFVFYAIPEDGGTCEAIESEVGEMVEDVEEKLESLVEKEIVNKFKRGRWDIYERVEHKEETDEPEAEESEEVEETKIDEDVTDEDIEETDGSEPAEKSNKQIILDNIPEDGCTLARLNREIEELEKDEIEELLNELIDDDRLTTIKRNRWTIYIKATNTTEVE